MKTSTRVPGGRLVPVPCRPSSLSFGPTAEAMTAVRSGLYGRKRTFFARLSFSVFSTVSWSEPWQSTLSSLSPSSPADPPRASLSLVLARCRTVRRLPAPIFAAGLRLRQFEPCDSHFQLSQHIRFRHCDGRSLPALGSLLYAPQHGRGFRLHQHHPPRGHTAERAIGVLEVRAHTTGPQELGAMTLDQCDKPTRPICIADVA